MAKFTNEDDEQLIELVAQHDILWKLSHPDYKSVLKKDLMWNMVGEQINKTGEQCKIRWRSIRDNFRRHKKIEATGSGQPAKKRRAAYWDRLRFLDDVEDERQGFTNGQDHSNEIIEDDIAEEESGPSNDPFFDHDDAGNVEAPFQMPDVNNAGSRQRCSPTAIRKQLINPKIRRTKNKDSIVELLKKRAIRQSKVAKLIENISSQQVTQVQEDEVDLFMRSMALTIKKFTPEEQSEVKRDIFNIVNQMEDRHNARVRAQPVETFSYNNSPSSYASSTSLFEDECNLNPVP